MLKRFLISLLVGLVVLLLAAVLLKPYLVQAQSAGVQPQDTTPYPGPEDPELIQEPVGESYPGPETPIEEESPAAGVPLFALVVVAVGVVVFILIAVLFYRIRRRE